MTTSTTSTTTTTATDDLAKSPSRDARLFQVTQAMVEKFEKKTEDLAFVAAPDPLLSGCQKITGWVNEEPSDADCPICLCPLEENVVRLSKCVGHSFHRDCIAYCYDKSGPFLKCPICMLVYGTRVGNQPAGTMNVSRTTTSLAGYEKYGTITVSYHFPDGVQGPEHRLPGSSYSGTSRTCYLPDNDEGKEVLALLDTSFKRKLTFTIGTSVTNGTNNTVIWNGIHHKTSTTGGPTGYGYPDPDYLTRVKEELKAVGVV